MAITMRDYPNPGAYVACIRKAKAHCAAGGTVKFHWNSPTLDRAGLQREIWRALDRRINDRGSLVEHGRKFDADYQVDLRRDRNAIVDRVTKRVRVYQFCTKEITARFSHLLSSYRD